MTYRAAPVPETSDTQGCVVSRTRTLGVRLLVASLQLERLPDVYEEPAYAHGTGEPLNPAAWRESHLELLETEYVSPAEREVARLLERTGYTTATGAAGGVSRVVPVLGTAAVTITMTLPSAACAELYASFAEAVGRAYGIAVVAARDGARLVLVVVTNGDDTAVERCIGVLTDPWAAGSGVS